MTSEKIFVTRPSLPRLEDFVESLGELWQTRILSNGGRFHRELEAELALYLGVPYVSLVNNGTVALQLVLMALGIDEGEVVTTPYTFAATAHVLSAAGATPVFADITAQGFNLDPEQIAARITSRTRAIMPVHCYGRPCEVEAIQAVADQHGLPVVYDAAHAFAVTHGSGSVLNHGRYATLSFHATKVFNTFEGGAIVSHTEEDRKQIDLLRNFGIVNEDEISEVGINGKMSEINAAFGLLQLKEIDGYIGERAAVDAQYRRNLGGVKGITIHELPEGRANFGYFPILVDAGAYGMSRDELRAMFDENGIFARKYFYPLLSNIPPYRGLPSADPAGLPNAARAAAEVLCLPIYPGLSHEQIDRICGLIVGRN